MYQNLQDTMKAVPWGKFVALSVYIKKKKLERSNIYNVTSHLMTLEKQL